MLVLAALVACAFGAGCRREIAPGPDVWAVVNGKEILREDVEKIFRSRVTADAPTPSQEEALSLQLSILDELVNSEILLQRANKMNLVASDAEVEDKFTESKSPYTEEEFQKKLKDTGLSVDDLRSDIRRQLSIQKLLNREVVAKISITDQDISDFYNKNRAQFNVTEPQYHIAQIVITPRADPTVHNRKNDKAANEAEAGRKAAMLIQKLNAGADFAELAADYSEDASASTGGDLGFQPQSSFNKSDPILKNAVLSLKPGGVTQPIRARGRRVHHPEAHRQRGLRPARIVRRAGAASHPRRPAHAEGAASPLCVSGGGARRSACHELSGAADPRIRRQTSPRKISDQWRKKWRRNCHHIASN